MSAEVAAGYTSPEVEAALWRSTMAFLYDKEEDDEEEEEEEEEEDEEIDPPQEPLGDDAGEGPELIPAGEGSAPPAAPLRTVGAVAGGALTAMAMAMALEWSRPPLARHSLRVRPHERREPVADYLNRTARVVLALRAHGITVSESELGMLTLLAEDLEFAQVGGDWHPTRMVRRLRTRFAVAALKGKDSGEDAADVNHEIQAIGELIVALGGKQSASLLPRQPWLRRANVAAALAGADGLDKGDSPLRAKLAALEMEIEALKRGSDGGASVTDGAGQAVLPADWGQRLSASR
ncbi:pol [Symbiodinium sp. CCMP2592]|nr:pol [Symbiodinium sp. CCMP2592]